MEAAQIFCAAFFFRTAKSATSIFANMHASRTTTLRNRIVAWTAVGITAWLLLLGCVYWRERMLFADAPHILFRIINYGTLQIQVGRWGAAVTQIVPLAASKTGLPLCAVMMLYSAAFNGFYLAVVLLLIFRHRRPDFALITALYYLLLVSDTFYWTNNEVHQGVGWMMIALGERSLGISNNRPVILRVLLFGAMAALAIWTHPLVMLSFLFLWIVLQADDAKGTPLERILCTILILSLAGWKYAQSRANWYDGDKLSVLDSLEWSSVKAAFTGSVARGFVSSVFTCYAPACAVLACGLVGLIRARKWRILGVVLTYAGGYFFLVGHTYREFDRFYIESEWMPMSFAASLPAVWYFLPRLHPRVLGLWLVVLVVWQSIWILRAAQPFEERLAMNSQTLQTMRAQGINKALLPEPDSTTRARLILHWAAPAESMLQSALDGERPQRTFAYQRADRRDSVVRVLGRNTMLSTSEALPAEMLNRRYFELDTTDNYMPLP